MYKKQKSYLFGSFGEFVARQFLRCKGYRIIEKNFRGKLGEIDIIALRKDVLCCVEVKARKRKEHLEISISPQQLQRIERSARNYVAQHTQFHECVIRFDIVYVLFPFFPRHVKNILETSF